MYFFNIFKYFLKVLYCIFYKIFFNSTKHFFDLTAKNNNGLKIHFRKGKIIIMKSPEKHKNRDSMDKYYNQRPDLTDFAVVSAMDCTGFIPSDAANPSALEAYLLMKKYRADLGSNNSETPETN